VVTTTHTQNFMNLDIKVQTSKDLLKHERGNEDYKLNK
jgi:hypothetical protein